MNNNSDYAIISVGTIPTGIQYYLTDIEIIDIAYMENLARLRDIIETNNITEVFLSLQNIDTGYLLLPHDVLDKIPYLYEFLNLILTKSVKLPSGSYAFFEKVISGTWNLYELKFSFPD